MRAGKGFMILWIVLGVICLVYGVLMASANSGNGFFVVWITLGAVFAILAFAARANVWAGLPAVLRMIVLAAFFAVLAFFIVIECMIGSRFGEKGRPGLDYIIVLGAQVHEDGPSTVLRYRLDRAAEYLIENPDTVCIVSGGQGSNEPFPEADGMKIYLEGLGISSERIITERESLTTKQNISNCMKIMPDGASVGIVTNNFHMFRALQIAKSAGLDSCCGISAGSTEFFLPNNMFREFFAEIKFLAGM